MIRFYLTLLVLLSLFVSDGLCNRPPKFVIEEGQSEIVLRLKEGSETPIGKRSCFIFEMSVYVITNLIVSF